VDPEALKLAAEIEASRQEIAKLQERVRQLVSRRGKRAELVKAAQTLATHELSAPATAANGVPKVSATEDSAGKELSLEEGLLVLKNTGMAEVRLIAFKHGAVIFLFADEKTLTVRMDERGPKPLLDLLAANDRQTHAKKQTSALPSLQSPERSRAE
jgi:hypothetical protein